MKEVQEAPEWLKERMRKLRELPPPTEEQVRIQWSYNPIPLKEVLPDAYQ